MPVSLLFVEGRTWSGTDEALERSDLIEVPIFQALLAGRPSIEAAGSKGSLKPRAWEMRQKGVIACYLRDRDFDADPPDDLSSPVVDCLYQDKQAGPALGWTWCRHEIESYLLEPALVSMATGLPEHRVAEALVDASRKIQFYTAARWTVGAARRGLLPPRELPTRPDDLKNTLRVPKDCSRPTCVRWALDLAASFCGRTNEALAEQTIAKTFARYTDRLAALTDIPDILLWHSGKDLFATLEHSLYQGYADNPKVLRRRLRNWVRDRPEEAIALLPEWQALRALLRQ